jgi:single-stranded DNA-binding protein
MTAFVLVSGSLWKNPEQRSSSRTGKLFVTATLRVGSDSGNGEFWSITTFSQSAQDELLRLHAGDALSCQGKLEIKTYVAADGTTKIGRSIIADHVLAVRAPPKERKSKSPPAGSKAADAIVKQTILPDATPEKETAAGGPGVF